MSDVTRFGVIPPLPEPPEEEASELSGLRHELARWLARLDAEAEEQRESLAREVRELRKVDAT